jgi:hypothetical protein
MKERQELTTRTPELTKAGANIDAGVLVVFTASLRSILIAFV